MFVIAIIVIIIIKEGKKCDSVAHKTSSDHVWLCFYGFLKLLRAAEKQNWYSTNQQNAALELFVRVSNCLFLLRASRRPVPAPSAGIWIEKPPRPISNQGNKSSGLPDSKAPEKRHRAAAAQSAKWPADEPAALGRKKKSKLTRNTDETQAKMDSKKPRQKEERSCECSRLNLKTPQSSDAGTGTDKSVCHISSSDCFLSSH